LAIGRKPRRPGRGRILRALQGDDKGGSVSETGRARLGGRTGDRLREVASGPLGNTTRGASRDVLRDPLGGDVGAPLGENFSGPRAGNERDPLRGDKRAPCCDVLCDPMGGDAGGTLGENTLHPPGRAAGATARHPLARALPRNSALFEPPTAARNAFHAGDASAAGAWARGQQGGPDAKLWLARAAFLAPEDPRIALDLARLRLAGDAAEKKLAEASFASIAARYDAPSAWLGLAIARQAQNNPAGAATAMQSLLQRHCLPGEGGFGAFADTIARAAGFDGFCAMDEAGAVAQKPGRLLGAPLDIAALNRVEGLAAVEGRAIQGWASRPAAPDTPPQLTLLDAAGRRRGVKFSGVLPPDDAAPFMVRHRFTIAAATLRALTPPFTLAGPGGGDIMGSPLDPQVLERIRPVPAGRCGRAVTRIPRQRALAIVVPVYRGFQTTRACLQSLLAARPRGASIIVVDDATPEPALASWLDLLAAANRILLRRHAANRGFCVAVNTGLEAAGGRDVLLLNSDTLIPPGAIARLRAMAYAHPATGSVTPLSNAATICSFPDVNGGNKVPDLAATIALNELAHRANAGRSQKIPTGIGFCLYLRHDCLRATGNFRDRIFAQGYGEENDFCLRARQLGFSHRVACGVFVGHVGGVSFGAAAAGLNSRNQKILNRLYPGYDALIMAHIRADPLRAARARMEFLRLCDERAQSSVLLISHSHGGGVARRLATEILALQAENILPLTLLTQFPQNPETTPYPWPAQLSAGGEKNLVFSLPRELPKLLRRLRRLRVQKIVLHHTLGHDPSVREIANHLGVPQTIVIHDAGSFCPRVNLLTRYAPDAPQKYCGEPNVAGCIACCAHDTEDIYEPIAVPALLARSAAEFAAAAKILVPSGDTAKRIARHFPGTKTQVTPWEDDTAPLTMRPPHKAPRRRIVVIGGIGISKGFDVLIDCARDAVARDLALDFFVAGGSADDAKLLETGRIFVTGSYREGDAYALLASLAPDLAFLPSIWPETWCFALSEAWRAGLYTVAFDLGAQAERIRATGRGLTLPLGLTAPRINDVLLKYQPQS
jgi:GT2 family glycosyltransferase/glycosyltransferase involved in cell wall biosynthesis